MVKIEVPYIDQSVKFPTGCESVSAVMLLQFLGYSVSVEEFIEKYLECRAFETRNGELYGPDPNRYFCGSPYDEDSFGCYAPVICSALERALEEAEDKCRSRRYGTEGKWGSQRYETEDKCRSRRYEVVNESGTSMEELLRNYIDQGMPVIFWACINMREPVTGPAWRLSDTGETFTWISNEHCMLLVGYDEEGYYFNDPYDNNGVICYPRETVEDRHRAQYSMAVGIKKCREMAVNTKGKKER